MLVGIANQIIGPKLYTGGDILALEVLKRNKLPNTVVLLPLSIKKYINDQYPSIKPIFTDKKKNYTAFRMSNFDGISIVFNFIIRTFNSIIILERNIEKIDTLYLTGDFICNTLPAAYLKFRKRDIKIVLNFYHRNPKPSKRKDNPYIRSAVSRLLQTISLLVMRSRISKVFVLSEVGKKELQKMRYISNKIIITGGGADDRYLKMMDINPSRMNLIKQQSKDILMIGRISRTKGIFDVPEILSMLEKTKSWKVNIVGFGESKDLECLVRMLEKYEIKDRVNLLGHVSEQQKWELLVSSKIFILTSHEEGYSIVTHEALMSNCRVVAYKLDSLYSLFNDYDINFVEKFNKISFSNKIQELLDTPYELNQSTMIAQSWDELALNHLSNI